MSTRLPLRWGITLGLLLGGCRALPPEASVDGAPQACCTVADPKLQNFKGCRIPSRSCNSRQGEKWWMRGVVACGPVDEQACEGGRCCHYVPQYDPSIGTPIENWAPPGHDRPTNNVTDPNAAPQHDVPAPGRSSGPTTTEPAPSTEATPSTETSPSTERPATDDPAPTEATEAPVDADG